MTLSLLVEHEAATETFAVAEGALPLLDAREAGERLRSGECDRIAIPVERLLHLWLTPHRNAVGGFVYDDLAETIAALAAAQAAASRPGATLALTTRSSPPVGR